MTTGEKKRERIFKMYSDSLRLLIHEKIIDFNDNGVDTYVCPICLCPFTTINDSDNPLTLEDVPPKSLGGSSDILTCKSCNNTCGYKLDAHLAEGIKEKDRRSFIKGTESKVKIETQDETLQATIKVLGNGHIEVVHSNKNNHPVKLSEQMQNLKKGNIVNMEFFKNKVNPENVGYAMLKTGYLLAFKMFGYSLIFENCYNVIREQLLHPEDKIYPDGFWNTLPVPKELSGVYFICNEGMEGLISIFELKTEFSQAMYATILPLPIKPIEQIIERINEKIQKENVFNLELYPLEQKFGDYLFNIENIKGMKEWIRLRNS